jgi:ABC-type cobalt transport system, ATPase component
VLILDEPTAGLDPKGRDLILNLIKEYHQVMNNTVIFVSHSMEDVARISKKVLVLNKSEAVMFDETQNVFKHAQKIKAMGLDLPQITEVFIKLSEKGLDINPYVYSIKEGKKEILKLCKEKGIDFYEGRN